MIKYDYLISSSISELTEGTQKIINILDSDLFNSTFIDYLILYSEKLLECTFNKFRNDDFEHLKPTIIYYKNNFKFVPIELKESIDKLLSIYEQLMQKKCVQKVKVRNEK